MAEKELKFVKSWNHFTVLGWMRTDLKLTGNDLLIYALVYGFSQEQNSWCYATQDYISEWTGASIRTVKYAISMLEEKGLIIKKEIKTDFGRQNVYKALKEPVLDSSQIIKDFEGSGNNCTMGGAKISEGSGNNCTMGGAKFSADTIYDNINNNINNNITDNIRKRTPKKPFIKPSLEEVQAYCTEKHYSVNPQRFIDYYDSNGWKVGKNPMKDWKAAVRTWQHNGYSNGGYSTGNSTTCGNNNPADYNDIFE
jgi:hypothetical protein